MVVERDFFPPERLEKRFSNLPCRFNAVDLTATGKREIFLKEENSKREKKIGNEYCISRFVPFILLFIE